MDLVEVLGQIQTVLNEAWGQVDPPIQGRADSHTNDRATASDIRTATTTAPTSSRSYSQESVSKEEEDHFEYERRRPVKRARLDTGCG